MSEESLISRVRATYDENVRLRDRNNKLINGMNKIIHLRNQLQTDLQKAKNHQEFQASVQKYLRDERMILDQMKLI